MPISASIDIGIAYEAAMQIFTVIWGVGNGMMLAFLIVFFSLAVTGAVYAKLLDG